MTTHSYACLLCCLPWRRPQNRKEYYSHPFLSPINSQNPSLSDGARPTSQIHFPPHSIVYHADSRGELRLPNKQLNKDTGWYK